MTQHWAIAVGINQYSFIQPLLMYAERDAAALYRYWTSEATFEPDRCRLLTPDSAEWAAESADEPQGEPEGDGDEMMPTEATLRRALTNLAQQTAEGDTLWFSFSGYGLQDEGEDYLLAADSTAKAPSPGLPLSEVMTILGRSPAQAVVLLDLKRPGIADGEGPGESTLALAEQHGVSVILSCRPDQIPHETLTLRHGLFTAALLESLCHDCVTVDQLVQDLSDRLPKLSEHHWRPAQHPMAYIPDAMRYQLLVPGKSMENPFPPPGQVARPHADSDVDGPDPDPSDFSSDFSSDSSNDAAATNSELEAALLGPEPSREPALYTPPLPSVPTVPAPTPQATVAPPGPSTSEEDQSFWRRVGIWGMGLLALLLLGVVIRNRSALFGEARPRPAGDEVEEAGASLDEIADTALTSARAAIEAERYQDALDWLDTVPPAARDSTYTQLRQAAEAGVGDGGAPDGAAPDTGNQQVNAEILAQAIASLNQEREETPVNQASDFARAIAIAERIEPGQPLYDDAQAYIQRWGNTVVDLAEARAQSGNYVDAINAAGLIPPSVPGVYDRAQERIQQWRQQLGQGSVPRSVIASAKGLIQPGQASSYSEAIGHLRLVQRSDADYDQARTLIDRWSDDILDLAYRRAYEGQFRSAIDAASLVPQDARAYVASREAIADWQWQVDVGNDRNEQIGTLPEQMW